MSGSIAKKSSEIAKEITAQEAKISVPIYEKWTLQCILELYSIRLNILKILQFRDNIRTKWVDFQALKLRIKLENRFSKLFEANNTNETIELMQNRIDMRYNKYLITWVKDQHYTWFYESFL